MINFVDMIPVTANMIKRVSGLDERKWRKREGAFKAEGSKCVTDTLSHFDLQTLYASTEWLEAHEDVAFRYGERIVETSRGDLRKMSSLVTPPDVIAVYAIPRRELPEQAAAENLVLALDTIQDPGNLGTIIRVADWFGINDVVASRETADCFSPKVIQSTMGAISRVRVHYCDLVETLPRLGATAVYGTFLDGDPIGSSDLGTNGVIVIGNEGNGISAEVERLVTHRLLIPSYPDGRATSESLNAAVATAITLAKFRGV